MDIEMLIYGSTAAKHWFPDFDDPKDIDYVSKKPISTREEQHYWTEAFQYILDNNIDPEYVDPDFLYTVKCSHASWDINWHKTMSHIMFLKDKGCRIDKKLYDLLYSDWEKIHGKKNVNLEGDNADFFTENISREFDHDKLHEHFAFYDRPMHEKIRENLDSPKCSKELWNKLSHEDKIKCCLEEAYVIATERYYFPKKYHVLAKNKALRQLIISMTKGWFNLFLVDNFKELVYSNNRHYLEKLGELNELR